MAENNNFIDINFFYGKEKNFFTQDGSGNISVPPKVGSFYLSNVSKTINSQEQNIKSYLYFSDGTSFLNIVPKLLEVENGGTGKTSLDLGKALIGNGTSEVDFRAITSWSADRPLSCPINNVNNLITEQTLGQWDGSFIYSVENDIPQYVYTLSKLGTINTGTWEANIIQSPFGGTGNNSYTENRIIYSFLPESKDGVQSPIKLISSNHFIDDNSVMFYYDNDIKTKATGNFIVNNTVEFFTSNEATKDLETKFQFLNTNFIIQGKTDNSHYNTNNNYILTYDVKTPSIVFSDATPESSTRDGALKWAYNNQYSLSTLVLTSSSTQGCAFLAPQLETNSIHYYNATSKTRHETIKFFNAKNNDGVGMLLGEKGPIYIFSSANYKNSLTPTSDENYNLNLISDNSIIFKTGDRSSGVILDTLKNFYPETDNFGQVGTADKNWSAVRTLNLIANSKLIIQANNKGTTPGDIEISAGTLGKIDITAGVDQWITLNNSTYITNDLILVGDIYYNNLSNNSGQTINKHSMIRFSKETSTDSGISIGGGGAVLIGSGASSTWLDGLLMQNKILHDNTHIAASDKIYFHPSRQYNTNSSEASDYLAIENKKSEGVDYYTFSADKDGVWHFGNETQNLKAVHTKALQSNDNLDIQSYKDILIKAGVNNTTGSYESKIDLESKIANLKNNTINLESQITNNKGELYLYNDVYYSFDISSTPTSFKVFHFDNTTGGGAGITIGGKGSTFIASGESVDLLSYSESQKNAPITTLTNGESEKLYLGSDFSIEIYTGVASSTLYKKTEINALGNILLYTTNRGYYLTDKSNQQYAALYDNGTNLWIGSTGPSAASHVGGTHISTGYDGATGYDSIYVEVPNSTNTASVSNKVFHEGMNLIPKTTNTYSIGNTTYKWKSLYLNNFTIGQGTIKNSVDGNVTCAYIETPGNAYIALGGPSTTYVFAGGDNKIGLGHANVRWKGLWTYGFTIDTNGRINNNVLPTTDAKFSLGSSSYKWNALYMPNLTISNKGEVEITHSNADNTWDSGYVRITGKNSHFTVTTSNAYELSLLMGSGGKNRGLYSRYYDTKTKKWTDGAWRFYVNASDDTVISGDSTVTITSVLVAQKGATFVSNGLNINYLNSKDISEGFSINPTFKHTATKVAALGTETYPWRIGYIDEIVIEKGTVNNVKITSDKRFKTLEKDEILETSLKIYDALTPVCYRYKNIKQQEDFDYSTHIGFFAQDVEQIIEEYGLNSEDYSLVQKSALSKECPQEIRDICSDGYRYYIDYNNLHGLHTIKNHQQDKKLFELENKNKELEEKIALLQNQIAMLIN